MNVNSPGSVTIAGVVVLESPRPIDPQKGPRNVVFDVNLCIVEGSQTVTMALLRYFAPSEMTNEIQAMADKDFQKAFIVANVKAILFLFKMKTTHSFSTDRFNHSQQYHHFHVRLRRLRLRICWRHLSGEIIFHTLRLSFSQHAFQAYPFRWRRQHGNKSLHHRHRYCYQVR